MSIRIHKKVNGNQITLGKDSLINTFYGLMELYNKQDTYNDLEITKQVLWELAGYSGEYKSQYIKELIKELTQSKPFEVGNLNKLGIEAVSGSMFVITTYTEGGKVRVEVPKSFRQLLFYKKDIDLMTKAKKKLRMSVEELDHWDRETKGKSKFLVLLKKADLLHIQGKYNKRLYALLMQWSYTGSYEVSMKDFKELLEIPKSYRASDIDKRILIPAKKELLKVGLKITRIIKKKEGRSITGIKISFKSIEPFEKEEDTIKNKALKGPKMESVKYRYGAEASKKPEESQEPVKNEGLENYKAEALELAKNQIKENKRFNIFKVVIRSASRKQDIDQMLLEYGVTINPKIQLA